MGRRTTRRRFLQDAGSAAAVALVASACGDSGDHKEATDEPLPPGASALAIVQREEIDAAVQTAVRRAGGIADILAGQVVFIKPNVVHPFVSGPAITTNPEVLAAVVRLVKARGATVVVGDRSARGFDTDTALDGSGLREAALAAGADEIYAAPRPSEDPSAWVLMQPEGWQDTWAAQGGVLAMRRIIEADHYINVPTCKDHRWAGFSLSIKAHMGAIGDDSRNPLHFNIGVPELLSRDLAVINEVFAPRLNILDAWDVLVNGGPEGTGTDAVRSHAGLILASTDRVALDAAGVTLIKLHRTRVSIPQPDEVSTLLDTTSPWEMPQIRHAIARGIGVASPANVVLRFDGVADANEITAIYSS